MSGKFDAETANLYASNLAELTDEQIDNAKNRYALMALLNPEEKEIIGVLLGIQKIKWFNASFKKFCKDMIPFMIEYGAGREQITKEVSQLALKAGHKNKSVAKAEEEDAPFKK